MTDAVDRSYRYCCGVARRRAKNFYYSFLLLSRQQRKAMCAIYAFMRYCDDLSDRPGATRAPIERWRAELEDALQGLGIPLHAGAEKYYRERDLIK